MPLQVRDKLVSLVAFRFDPATMDRSTWKTEVGRAREWVKVVARRSFDEVEVVRTAGIQLNALFRVNHRQ